MEKKYSEVTLHLTPMNKGVSYFYIFWALEKKQMMKIMIMMSVFYVVFGQEPLWYNMAAFLVLLSSSLYRNKMDV